MGGVNHRFGYDQKKTQKLGNVFPSIDFERNESLHADQYRSRDKSAIVGEFLIAGKRIKVTYHELRRIMETAEAGLDIVDKAYKLGRLPGR